MKTALQLLLVSLLATFTLARKSYLVKETLLTEPVAHPIVRGYDGSACAFDNSNDKFCLDLDIDLEWGTKWTPSSRANEYDRIQMMAYTKQLVVIHPELDIDRFFYFMLNGEVEDFLIGAFWEATWFSAEEKLCFAAGWYTEPIKMYGQAATKLQECYKNLIDCLTTMENWVGQDARWIDECSASSDKEVTIYEYEPYTDEKSNYWYGSDSTGVASKCVSLAAGSSSNQMFSNMLVTSFQGMYNYLENRENALNQ